MADDIYSVVSLFLYYSQFFGLNPVILKRKDGKYFFKPFWIGVLYTFGLAAFLLYSFQFAYGNLSMFADNDSDIMFMHTVCKMVFGPVCNGIIFVSSMLSVRNLCNVINKLSEYDQVFQKHVATMRYKWIKWIFLFAFLCSLCLCSAYFYNEDVVLRKVSERKLTLFEFVSFFMSWCLFDIISWTLILVMFCFMYLVFKKFQQINDKLTIVLGDYGLQMDKDDDAKIFALTKSAHSSRKPSPHIQIHTDGRINPHKEVANIRYLHILLIRIAQDLNAIFATRLFAITALNVVLLCFSSFLLILMLVIGRRDNVLVTAVIWVCVRFFPTCALIFPFSMVTNEADRTSTLIHETLARVEEPIMREELRIFSMQLANRKLVFTAHNFFTLDNKTIISVVGSSFAYLVVLLQFHVTLTSIKNPGNSTESGQRSSMD